MFENFSNHGAQFKSNLSQLRVVIFENFSNHGGQFKRMVEVSYLNNVHQNVWFKPPRYGYSYPEVNLKGFYGWDGGGVLLEQCFWYKKYASMMNLRMG